ncbi:MAG: DUF4105 domain-containing protein [Gemmatimonadales bacterium]|nr:MAG: DUF4105 domain-containing protein [Gemmatimonadales bacterium]
MPRLAPLLLLLAGLLLPTPALSAAATAQVPAATQGQAPDAAQGQAPGQVPAPDPVPDSAPRSSGELRVFLVTMGQGDEVWERFGHNALVITEAATGQGLAWNWGLFDFGEVDFIPRFLRGDMRYQMGPQDPEQMLAEYRMQDRTVWANEVLLSAGEARALQTLVRSTFDSDARFYRYDYFRDNCSTRVRDALDQVLNGAIARTFSTRETDRSYRWHCRRLVGETRWIDLGLSYLLGLRGDRPRTEHEVMFIPMDLMTLLEETPLRMGDGSTRRLLGPRQVLHQSSRPPTPRDAPGFDVWTLVFGLLLGGLVAGLAPAASRRSRSARAAAALVGTAWSLLAAGLGWLLVFAWFTDHTFIHWNLNLLHTNPLSVAVAVLLPVALLRGRKAGPGLLRTLALLTGIIAALSWGTAALQLIPPLRQGNAEVLALALPLNLALWLLAVALVQAAPRPAARPGSGAPAGSATGPARS